MNKKIELERCPVCGGEVDIVFGMLDNEKRYSICCSNCEMLFGFESEYGCLFDTEEEAVREWNSGKAFRYKKMWEELRKSLPALKERANMSALTKQGIFDSLAKHMDWVEEEAFREDDV